VGELFYDALDIPEYIVLNGRMMDGLERIMHEGAVVCN
jgi:hypothetical protein